MFHNLRGPIEATWRKFFSMGCCGNLRAGALSITLKATMNLDAAANELRMRRYRELKNTPPAGERLRLAREASRFLHGQGARRVWLFGSLARGNSQDWRSDLDLATEGLPPERYLGALGELLMRLPLSVDLVEIESAPAPLRAAILRDGIELAD